MNTVEIILYPVVAISASIIGGIIALTLYNRLKEIELPEVTIKKKKIAKRRNNKK